MGDDKIPPPPDSETRKAPPPPKPPATEEALVDAYVKLSRGEWGSTPEAWLGLGTEIGRGGVTLGEVSKRVSAVVVSAAASHLPYADVAGIAFIILANLNMPDVVGERAQIVHDVLRAEAADDDNIYKGAAQGRGAAEELQRELLSELGNVVRLFKPYIGFAVKYPPGDSKPIPKEDRADPSRLYTGPRNAVKMIGRGVGSAVGLFDVRSLTGNDIPVQDNMLAIEAALAAHLETLGASGKAAAKAIRDNAPARLEAYRLDGNAKALWAKWLVEDATSRAPVHYANLATVLWRDVVGPKLEEERRKPPALVRPVYSDTLTFHGRRWGSEVESKNTQSLTFAGRELARAMGASFDLDVILRGLSLLGSMTAHRLFRWEVMTGYEQCMSNTPSPNQLEVPGGWAGLARILKMDPDKHATDLRALVKAQAHYSFTFPNGSQGNMLSYLDTPGRARRPAHLTISLGPALMPQYAFKLGADSGSDARQLVPLLRQLPPLYGRPNEHGQQLTMALSVVAELRLRARELATAGSVKLTLDDFARMADRAGLRRPLILPVQKVWLDGTATAPPFLLETSTDHYTLADTHAAERDFIIDGGRREVRGSELGARSAQNRDAMLNRLEKARSKRNKPKGRDKDGT